MGFFKKLGKKFKQTIGFDPAWGVTTAIEDWASDPTGAKKAAKQQVAALRAAGRIEEAQRVESEMFRQEAMAGTAGFREQGRLGLEKYGAQTPGSTEFYKQALARGTTDIAERAAGFGLLDAGSTRRGFGELGANLLTQEEQTRQQNLARSAELSQTGYGVGLSALGQQGAAAYRGAQTAANIGAVKAGATTANRGFWTGLATQAGGAALGSYLGAPPAPGGIPPAPGTGAQGGYNLQRGTGYNQFQSPY